MVAVMPPTTTLSLELCLLGLPPAPLLTPLIVVMVTRLMAVGWQYYEGNKTKFYKKFCLIVTIIQSWVRCRPPPAPPGDPATSSKE